MAIITIFVVFKAFSYLNIFDIFRLLGIEDPFSSMGGFIDSMSNMIHF